jgi:hypothetical protein
MSLEKDPWVKLIPHSNAENPPGVSFEVKVERMNSLLNLEYRLSGNLSSILIPTLKEKPERSHLLWQHTCFEAFLSQEEGENYWELNVSPSGDWNFYRFDRYRQGQQEELIIKNLQAEWAQVEKNELTCRLSLDLGLFMLPDSLDRILLGLTGVLEERTLSKTYWANQHVAPQPDFHLRKSFIEVIRSF